MCACRPSPVGVVSVRTLDQPFFRDFFFLCAAIFAGEEEEEEEERLSLFVMQRGGGGGGLARENRVGSVNTQEEEDEEEAAFIRDFITKEGPPNAHQARGGGCVLVNPSQMRIHPTRNRRKKWWS